MTLDSFLAAFASVLGRDASGSAYWQLTETAAIQVMATSDTVAKCTYIYIYI